MAKRTQHGEDEYDDEDEEFLVRDNKSNVYNDEKEDDDDADDEDFHVKKQLSATLRKKLSRHQSVTFDQYVKERHLDEDTAEMLRKYDEDGNGIFSKDEVVDIIRDLRATQATNQKLSLSNKAFRRIVWALVCLCSLLLVGMFALSWAVAIITKDTAVEANGEMKVAGSDKIVATNAAAETFVVNDEYENEYDSQSPYHMCIDGNEADEIHGDVMNGRNVILDFEDPVSHTETSETLSAGGAQFSNGGNSDDTREGCYLLPEGGHLCVKKTDKCPGLADGGNRKTMRRLRGNSGSLMEDDNEHIAVYVLSYVPTSANNAGNEWVGLRF